MLLIILLVVLGVALLGGGIGHRRIGYAGWSPAGVVILVLVILAVTGRLHC